MAGSRLLRRAVGADLGLALAQETIHGRIVQSPAGRNFSEALSSGNSESLGLGTAAGSYLSGVFGEIKLRRVLSLNWWERIQPDRVRLSQQRKSDANGQ